MLVKTLILALIMLSSTAVNAAVQEYIREYVHRVGDADSKVTSRQVSIQGIKAELPETLATYIKSRIENTQGNQTESEFKEELTALITGYVQVDILEERFDGETYYLKAKLSADPDDVVTRINQFSNSTQANLQDKEQLVQAYQENKTAINRLAALQEDILLNKAAGKKTQNLEQQYIDESQKLSISEFVELGNDYSFGRKGKSKDYTQAASWYRKAAEKSHAAAQYNLGVMNQSGYGVTKDNKLAVFWYRKAAEQGKAKAQFNLGLMYYNGYGVNKDLEQTLFWYRKAADQNLGEAQYNLGLMYVKGEGLMRDATQSLTWWRKSATTGFAEAQYNMGVIYQHGYGVSKNHSQALSWFRKATAQGHVEAQKALSKLL
jgi:TPR repeat protein